MRQVNPCLDRMMDPPRSSDLTPIVHGVNADSSNVLKWISKGVGLSTLQILWKLVVGALGAFHRIAVY